MNRFIVIEGLDGAGTTTQSRLLAERLQAQGERAHLTHEPSAGPIGSLIRQMLSMRVVTPSEEGPAAVDREILALLFAADRLDHVRSEIEPALADGAWVVSDRYYHSSFAYQGDAADDRFDVAWVRRLNDRAPEPDLTFFLKADVDVCLERIDARVDRDIYETREKLERLERRYEQIIALLETEGEKIVTFDASLPIDEIHQKIWAAVAP